MSTRFIPNKYLYVLDELQIEQDKLPDLSVYYEIERKLDNRLHGVKIEWGSIENYVNALYYMRFVKRLDVYECAELLQTNTTTANQKFAPFNWYNYYPTLEECEKERIEIIERIQKELDEIDQYEVEFDNPKYKAACFLQA